MIESKPKHDKPGDLCVKIIYGSGSEFRMNYLYSFRSEKTKVVIRREEHTFLWLINMKLGEVVIMKSTN